MSELLAFQRHFVEAISRPIGGPLRVYRNTVIQGAVEALRANFPVVEQILGDEMFDCLAAEHAALFPPASPILAMYGEDFAEWLEEQSWLQEFPYLSDVARIERMHVECLFAADRDPLHLGELANADWDSLHIRLHPAARFDWFLTPAASIWLAHQRNSLPDEFAPRWKGEGLLFVRPHLTVWPVEVDAAVHRLLLGIVNGESVGCAALAAAEVQPDAEVGTLFATLVNGGAFAALPVERTIQ
jgi:hypothetical protein